MKVMIAILSLMMGLLISPFLAQNTWAECSKSELRQQIKQNRININNLKLGMTKAEVMEFMGEYSCRWLVNPYKVEAFALESNLFEILYYAVGRRGLRKHGKLTPLVFKNGKLEGWGFSFLSEIKNWTK